MISTTTYTNEKTIHPECCGSGRVVVFDQPSYSKQKSYSKTLRNVTTAKAIDTRKVDDGASPRGILALIVFAASGIIVYTNRNENWVATLIVGLVTGLFIHKFFKLPIFIFCVSIAYSLYNF